MQIIMPKLGLTMTHGTITEWLKAPGDAVKAEEVLCTYETEKVTLELTAPEDGVLIEILVPAGAAVPAGAPVCELSNILESGQTARAESVSRGPAGTTPKARVLARQLHVDFSALAGSGPDGRVQASDVQAAYAAAQPAPVRATPLARRIAAAEGIPLTGLRGSGAEGTVTRADVERTLAEEKAQRGEPGGRPEGVQGRPQGVQGRPEPSAIIPHSTLRRTIADRMSQSAFTAPHVTLMTEAEATNLVSARIQLNQELRPEGVHSRPEGVQGRPEGVQGRPEGVQGRPEGVQGGEADKISYNTLLAALTARALREHPTLNARWEADGIHLLPEINIALAVDTERGLMTPVLRGVDKLSLIEVQHGYAALASRALAGRSLPDDFAGGTFTVTNLGGLDVDGFTPIINPPQAAILGVGRIVEKPVARDGSVVVRPMVTLSLSFDHRIVDGGPAAKFLQRVKQLVERPMALLLRLP